MKRSDEQVGEDLGMSRASVQRLMRVNQLEEPLKKVIDKKELPLDTRRANFPHEACRAENHC